tara:strand:- start:879 stop:2171 length:1293 start_codon:yes stop_codon:yes gene_type:complete
MRMADKPSLYEVENAFQPAKEVTAVERFAGRRTEVEDGYYGLLGDGVNIAIVGNRGVGKTSLSRQLEITASGDNGLLDHLEIGHDRPLDFLSVYFACGNRVTDFGDLLERLLTTSNCLGDWIYDIPGAKKEVVSYAPEIGAKLFGLEAKLGGEKATEQESRPAVNSHSIDTVFTNVCHAIVEERIAKDGLLIIVDEFDQINDPSGMAGFMKSLATNVPRAKFCLVGVAQDIQNLMKEHESVDRLFSGSIIRVHPMEPVELREIIRIAEAEIDSFITFDEEATDSLIALAQGHPYMVHLIGKYAFRAAYQRGVKIIDRSAVQETLKSIAERGADPVLEGRYKKAVGSSRQRESVLRALAQVRREDGECWTTDAYKIALEDEVDNASQFVGHLVADDYGSELEKVRERYYRFRDSLFATYVLARPRLYSPVG